MRAKRNPSTPAEIIDSLRDLSRYMISVGTAMDYYGGLDTPQSVRGLKLVAAGKVVAS